MAFATENEAGENIRRGVRARTEIKGGLMSPSRTTRDFLSHVELGPHKWGILAQL